MYSANFRRALGFLTIVFSLFISFSISAQNNALNFDGTDDIISVTNNAAFEFSTGTVEMWIRPATSGNKSVISMRDGTATTRWALYVDQTSGTFGIWNGSTVGTTSSTTITAGTWYHVAYVMSTTTTDVYLNGVQVGSTLATGINTAQTGKPVTIGWSNDAGFTTEYFSGDMDEVRIWSDARTELEIRTNMTKSLTGSESNLVAYYNFDEGTAASDNSGVSAPEIQDQTANNFDGTLSGFAKTGSTSNWVDGSGNDVGATFITTWQTTTASETVQLPTGSGTYNYTINWGDGTVEALTAGDPSHVYATAGTYAISIDGAFPHFQMNNNATHRSKILTIEQWGDVAWTSMQVSFRGCNNLTYNATDAPDLSGATEMDQAFRDATSFNGDLSNWNVSTIDQMTGLFRGATSFNQDLSNWNVGTVAEMGSMFLGATAFNNGGTALTWGANTSNVQTMESMFTNATSFNQDISGWDVSTVSNMFGMFTSASAFNQNLGDWDISSVANMQSMLDNTNMSVTNYDNTLTGWATLSAGETQIPSNLTLGASGLVYCSSTEDRNNLDVTFNWTFSGDAIDTSGPEINVQGNSNNIVDGSTAINSTINTDFGTQTSSNAIVYTIQNTGSTTLNISSITSTGTNAGDFVVSGAPTTVASSGSETFTVTFGPLATGTRNATITINSDDCDEAVYDFAVQGVGDTNHALDFDGADDDIIVSGFAASTGSWTYEFLFSPTNTLTSADAREDLIYYSTGSRPHITFNRQGDGSIGIHTNIGGAGQDITTTTTSWTAGTWYHLAFSYDGTAVKAYVNGIEENSLNVSGASNAASTLNIGSTGSANFFSGQMDEVRIWSVARTCSEILSTKDVELTGSETGLDLYYNFNQNEAGGTNTGLTTLDDLTANNNDGTLTGFALTGSTSNWVDGSGNSVSNSTTPADQPEINVQGNSNDIADGSTTINTTIDTDFGFSSNAIVYTIQNTGTATLNISSITSTGTNSSEFVVSGAPSTVAASGSETFTVTFTAVGPGTKTATITINSDDCDEAAYDFAIQGSGSAPGGFGTDLQLWLKAGEDFTVSQWDDQSGNSNHATQGTASAQPSSTANAINFNTAVDFDGSDFLTLTNNAGTMGLNNSDYELFFVANSSSTAIQFFMSAVTQERYEMHINGDAGHRFIPANATNFSDIGSNSDYDDGITRIFGGTLQSSGASAASHVNGLFSTDIETAGLQTSETGAITIGRRESNDMFHWTGQMGEVIIYGDAMNSTQRQQVFSYLSLKYGITLDQTSATDYLAADGATVWNATTNAAYNDDIAGLARDDASELDQRQSGSINTGAIVELANGTHASPTAYTADDSWLIWGHDGGASTFGTDNINNSNATTSNRMTRVWRAQETGTVGTVQIRFSNSLATGTVSIVAHTSDATFPADGNRRVVEMTDDGTHYLGEIDLADGEYFSFANANYATLTSQFVVINEVITDPQQDWGASNFFNPSPGGTGDADDEWIELYITTDDLNMSSWTIEMNDGTDVSGSLSAGGAFNQSNYRSLTGGSLSKTKSGDYLILGDPSSGMMNSTGGLTVILKDGSGGIIDQVTIATGSGTGFSGSASSTTDESVARIPNGSDTDVDATDFVKTRATLGETSAPSGTVVINEVVTDPFTDWNTSSFDGSIGAGSVDANDEWIELYIGTAGLNLTGWTIEMNDGTDVSGSIASGGVFATVNYVTTLSGTFINTAAGDYLILGNPTGEINNTGLTIILRDASNAIVDQVTIGGGTGEAPSGSNSAFNSEAIVRYPNATDTGTDDADFIQTRPTLGTTNSPTGTVVINEVVTDPQQDWSANGFDGTIGGNTVSSTDTDEWVELYIASSEINLTGWTISLEDGSGDIVNQSLAAGGAFSTSNYIVNSMIGSFENTEAGDFLVLGNPTGSGTVQMNNDVQITLRDASGNTVDQVKLGGGSGEAPSGSATGISDEAIARIPNGTDTDNSASDFTAGPATLGAVNQAAQLPGIGNALAFDGTDDYVNIASPFTGYTNEITVEAWINLNTLTTAEGVMAQSTANSDNASTNVWLLGNIGTSNGSLSFFVWDGSNVRSTTSSTDFRGTGWHHVVGVADATSTRIYVDGVLESSGAAISTGIQSNASAVIHIGKDARYASGRFLDGTVDEVRIWNSARTQEQILEGMQSLEDPSSSGLQTYYRFDQSSGTTLNDLTSNNRDGSLTNMAGTEWTAAGWDIFAQNQAIFQAGGSDTSTGTSGELTLTDVSFLNDDNDILLAGHDNGSFSEDFADLPSGTLVTTRYGRIWNLTKNDASGTSNGSVRLGFDLGATPNVTYTYYLLERTGTSGDFAIVPILGVNPNGNSIEFTVDASAIDNGSYYTLGRSDAGVGNALDFDGTNDHVRTAILRTSLTDFTMEAWFKYEGAAGDNFQPIFGGSSSDFFIGKNTGNTDIGIQDNQFVSNVASGTDAWDGNWHHIAVTRTNSSNTISIFLDGVSVGSNSTFTGGTGDLWIAGEDDGGPLYYFNGVIDEVRIWNDIRSQQEILDNMFANLSGDEAGLTAYFRLNQGIGDSNTTLPDLSPNGNNGTLTNFDNLGGATASSNYIASDRTTIAASAVIANGGDLTATDGELTLTSTQNAGDFLQDANDFIRWNNDGGAFSETTADIPTGTLVTNRYTKTWQLDKNDAVGTANGNVTFTFDLGAVPDPDYTYFVLSRSGTSGDFSIVEALGSSPSGNSISFVVDAAEVTDNHYFTLGRTDAGAGNSLDFDGTNDHVTLGDVDALDGRTTFTFEAWVKPVTVSTGERIFSKEDGTGSDGISLAVFGASGDQLQLAARNGSNSYGFTGSVLSIDSWNHVAYVYNGAGSGNAGKLKCYVNGIERPMTFSTTIPSTFSSNAQSFMLGIRSSATDLPFDGEMDEVRIWSDVRTEQEIKDNLNRKLDIANESNLLAYYQFNTGIASGTNTGVNVVTDRSGTGNSGTLTNFALSSTASNWVTSAAVVADQTLATSLQGSGNALNFDGVNEFVSVPDDASLETSSTLTVEAWVRPDVTTSFRGIAARYFTGGDASNVFALQINSGNYQFVVNESDNNLITASSAATASTWTHVAGVADGTNVNIYVDGILMSSTAYDGTITSNSSRGLFIGKYRTEDLFGAYDGLIDEVRIWNTARTAAEIQSNMFESLTGSETGLMAYYTFNESTGTTLDDNSVNSNTGTLNNMDDTNWVDASAREPFKTNGPGNLNSGGTWVGGAAPGASQTLYVQHDLTVDADLTVDDFNLTSGNTLTLGAGQTLTVTGNLVNNGTISGDGKIQFTSGNPMISGGTFSNLEMNGGSPILCGNTTMTGTLTLTSGNLQLEDYTLTLNSGATISGGSSSSYIQTINRNASGGSVEMEVAPENGNVTYPIGTSRNYTPITFTNLGTTATFAIRTFDGIYPFNTFGQAFTSNVISKTWDVNATGSGFNITLTIQWNTADELTGFDRTNMYISTNDGSGWVERAGPLSASEVTSGVYQASASGITGFSGVGGGGDVVTPVTLLDFYAQQIEEGIELIWHTATEIDNEKFVIERSADGIAFSAIDEVPGNGDSEDIIEYRFVDSEPLNGTNYYRLKQMDFDGDFEYSPIVLAEAQVEEHEWVVYPNPFSDRLYIGLKEAEVPANIKLTSMNGQVILSETVVSDSRFIQFENIQAPTGLYILEIQQGDEMVRMRIVNE